MQKAIKEALLKPGFTFIEILSPCPTLFVRRNKLGDSLAVLQDYKERSVIKHGSDTREAELLPGGPIVCGKFVETDRPSYIKTSSEHLQKVLGEKYKMPESWQEAKL